jgi:hypothetical protein
MPYISQVERDKFEMHIDGLSTLIAAVAMDYPEETSFAGLLNYTVSELTMRVVHKRFGKLRYGIIATVCGVLTNVKDELYRRVAAPYEDKAIAKNGDTSMYDAYGK